MSLIRIPGEWREVTGQIEVEVSGNTVQEALDDLVSEYPKLEKRLFNNGKVNKFALVCLNDEDIRHIGGVEKEIKDDDTISIVPAVSGG